MTTAVVRYQHGLGSSLFRRIGLLRDLQRSLRQLERAYRDDVRVLRQFERRFRPAVGVRYEELDRLREKVDRAWTAIARARTAAGKAADGSRATTAQQEEDWASVASAMPGGGARLLFLTLVRRVHPDLAPDEDERRRRHEIMAEATFAYRNNDERRLQWLLEHWEGESGAIDEFGPDSIWRRTNRSIAWTRYRIREMQHSIAQLHASAMASIMERDARARLDGGNLILELRKQAQASLEAAHRELDRIREALDDFPPDVRKSIQEEAQL